MEEGEDSKPIAKCDEERLVWAKHLQCDAVVQDLEDTPWRNKEQRNFEEGLAKPKPENVEMTAKSNNAIVGACCDGFIPRLSPDLSTDTRADIGSSPRRSSSVGSGRNKLAR